jgi:hypothetical protein
MLIESNDREKAASSKPELDVQLFPHQRTTSTAICMQTLNIRTFEKCTALLGIFDKGKFEVLFKESCGNVITTICRLVQ